MTVFHFKKKLVCGKKCHENFEANIMKLIPEFDSGVNGHVTMFHENPHEVWITFYTDNFHENWSLTGIKKTKFNSTQKRFTGKLPTLKQLEKL
jgi:hypothetical protein